MRQDKKKFDMHLVIHEKLTITGGSSAVRVLDSTGCSIKFSSSMLFEVRLELERSLAVVTWLSARFRAMGKFDDKLLLCRTEDFFDNVSVMNKDLLQGGSR